MDLIMTVLNGENDYKAKPGIYCIVNSVNGNKYVGQSNNIRRRFAEHRIAKNSSCTLLSKALKKHGKQNFSFAVYEYCSLSQLNEREVLYILELNPEYNISKGGKGNKGHNLSDAVKSNLSISAKGAWNNKSEAEKIRIIKKNLTGPQIGHTVSNTTRERLRLANVGKKHSKSTIQKIAEKNSVSMVGNSNGNKPVLQITNSGLVEWPSIKAAADHLDIHPSNITKALRGIQITAGGFKWQIKN